MASSDLPRLVKWPFYAGDLFLVILALWIAWRSPDPFALWPLLFMVLAVMAGAWLSVVPQVMEYRAAMRFAESDRLTTAVAKIGQVEELAGQIGLASSQWQDVQAQSEKTVQAAREIAAQMVAQVKDFTEFLQRANDSEKNFLRLEVDKLRRAEGEWLQILVRILDHVYALYQAGARSGQPNVREQLTHFQNACRDVARRVGLVPFEAGLDDQFDENRHQLAEADGQVLPGGLVAEALATGYTFQGQLLRRALVRIKEPRFTESEPEALADLAEAGQLEPSEEEAVEPPAGQEDI